MSSGNYSRRNFMEHCALGLGATALPFKAFALPLTVRPEWQSFKTTSGYDSLVKAIKLMKANTNASDPKSWTYWTNVHVNYCPHTVPYFLSWHRGYMYYFEKQLRTVSGNSQLVLPYWDYYTNTSLPAEFTNPNNSNPLYVPRVNTNVYQALTMAPFSSGLINFQRGKANAYEPVFEDAPHNPVHNIIGSWMADMQSPVDPIFWLHHANVDRLWVAWVNAGGGRKMPAITNSYWAGTHTYASNLTMLKSDTFSTRTVLGYSYKSESLPTRIPVAQLSMPNIHRVQNKTVDLAGAVPAVGSFRLSTPRQTGDKTFAVGGSLNVGLDERSVSAQLPVSGDNSRTLADIAQGKAATLKGSAKAFRSAHLVLDDINITDEGAKGGFFYRVYLNVPSSSKQVAAAPIYLGTLGAFEINAVKHHAHMGDGVTRLRYPIGRLLAGAGVSQLGMMSVSFVRVSGDNNPKGGVIGLGEVRLEASTDEETP
jgi:tyrosinase